MKQYRLTDPKCYNTFSYSISLFSIVSIPVTIPNLNHNLFVLNCDPDSWCCLCYSQSFSRILILWHIGPCLAELSVSQITRSLTIKPANCSCSKEDQCLWHPMRCRHQNHVITNQGAKLLMLPVLLSKIKLWFIFNSQGAKLLMLLFYSSKLSKLLILFILVLMYLLSYEGKVISWASARIIRVKTISR